MRESSTTSVADEPDEPDDSVPESTEVPPSTAAPEPTTLPTVAPTVPREESIVSMCGTVTVSVDGSATRFVRAEPLAGFEVDVKNSGPREVEVGFADRNDECEIKVRVVEGDLKIDVHDNPGDGH